MSRFLMNAFRGPRLFRIYQDAEREGRAYEPNALETIGDTVIKSITVLCSIGFYTSPLVIALLFKRAGYLCSEGYHTLAKYFSALGIFYISALAMRGVGRFTNREYTTFISALEKTQTTLSRENKRALCKYDFEFHAWPVEYDVSNQSPKFAQKLDRTKRTNFFDNIKALPCQIASFIAVHTIGRRMVYPGSLSLMHLALRPLLLDGRAQLVENHHGERFKIRTSDGNDIDTMFVDRRQMHTPNGNILVICCEGNAGFYEYGTMGTPLSEGFSVLGWNHPGFGGSTGLPYPNEEVNAIDAVIQFAINKLKFEPKSIVIFAWSIGGYTATWGAMTYPDIKGLVLDATFDNLLPLALCRMPSSWGPLVRMTIKEYMNLNNADNLSKYSGPVLLIRRTQDEMISTKESDPIQSNRGNDLLISIFQKRFPKLMTPDVLEALRDWLSGDRDHQVNLWNEYGVHEETCLTTLRSYIEANSPSYPLLIGDDMTSEMKIQLVLYLAHKHMVDFNSTHCTPLPSSLFNLPWDIMDVQEEL